MILETDLKIKSSPNTHYRFLFNPCAHHMLTHKMSLKIGIYMFIKKCKWACRLFIRGKHIFFNTERTVITKAYIVLSYNPWLFCEDNNTEFVNLNHF